MATEGLLAQAFIFLLAAVIAVPVAKKCGLGSVLGYLLAGAIIGPYVLGLVGEDVEDVMHFAEFGVVMMLFLVGLELQPSLLWRLRSSIIGLGGSQVMLSSIVLGAIAMIAGLDWRSTLAIALVLSLSSTAIGLQIMAEKGLMQQQSGQSAFSVLLFQDIAVIPILAIMPLLASGDVSASDTPGWIKGISTVLVVAAIVLGGRFLGRPLFRVIASAGSKEIFTATALLLVVGTAMLMDFIGLSAALGTFLAGVVLADSEYKHELEVEIEPFKGLLLGLFFISVGASIQFTVFFEQPLTISILVIGLMAVKMAVLLFLSRLFRLQKNNGLLLSATLAQGGEFCFVLFSYTSQYAIINEKLTAVLIVVVALSMALTPLLIIITDRIIAYLLQTNKVQPPEADVIDDDSAPVIVAGMGRFGQIVSRLLMLKGYKVTILEHDPGQIELVRKFGSKAFYGEASSVDILRAAGAEKARLLIVAVDDVEAAENIVINAGKHFAHLKVLARARDLPQAHKLEEAGADLVVRETFFSALQVGEHALRALGMEAYRAHKTALAFSKYDSKIVKELASLRDDEKQYISHAVKSSDLLTELLQKDGENKDDVRGFGWDEHQRDDPDAH